VVQVLYYVKTDNILVCVVEMWASQKMWTTVSIIRQLGLLSSTNYHERKLVIAFNYEIYDTGIFRGFDCM
jgi:hypothetical protein